jgi:HPt (histidine-containing phosphotransfer) domain-containing protein
MPNPPPNAALADLAAVLGDDNVRTLVRTFLRDFPVSFQLLSTTDQRKERHRIVHSMKSNSRLMGAHDLSRRMAALEDRLADENGADLNAQDLAAISAEFETIAAPLRVFAAQ